MMLCLGRERVLHGGFLQGAVPVVQVTHYECKCAECAGGPVTEPEARREGGGHHPVSYLLCQKQASENHEVIATQGAVK